MPESSWKQGEQIRPYGIYLKGRAVEGAETFAVVDEIRDMVKEYYDESYVVGDATSNEELSNSFQKDNIMISVLTAIRSVWAILLFTFQNAGLPFLLVLTIQGSIWDQLCDPTYVINDKMYFLSYLIVSSIQMGATIDYAIVITSRYMAIRKEMTDRKAAIIETLNQAFPTIITSGTMMVCAGFVIGALTSNATIASLGKTLGRGALISIILVMSVLPQLLLVGDKLIDNSVDLTDPANGDRKKRGGFQIMKRQKLNSRRTAALLASTLVLSQAEPILALADVKVETAAETVTDENTVVITSVDDLVQMSKNCVSESYSKGKTFVLTQDISLDGSDFQPIAVFAGNFQGNGHVISGLNITISGSNLGLFRYIEADGAVRGLIVKGNVKPDGSKKQIGGIVGTNRGTIENCEFHGMVSGQEAIGGIAGTNEEGAVIRGCKSYSVTTGNNKTGGITGNNDGTVEQCENHGDINASDQGVEDSNSGELSINTDKIKETVQKEKVNDAGGIAGYSKGKISDCKNYGTVGYEHIGYNIGGIAGRQCGIISQCYNLGDIRGRKDAGGIVGQFEPYLTIDHEEDLYDQLNSQLNSLSDISKALARTVDDTANKSTDSLDQIGDNMDQVRDIGKFYKDVYREDIDKMNNDLDSTTNDMQETLDHLHLRLIKDSSKSKVRALQQLLHDSDDIRKELKERYDGDLTDTDALKAWLQHRYELLSQLYENMQKVSEAVPDLMGSITEDSVNGVEDFGDKIEDLTSDINVMMDEIKYNRNNLKTDLENMDDELEVKIDSLADHVDSLQDSLKSGKDQTQAQRQQLEDQIDQIRNTITDKADEVRDKMEDDDLFDDVSDNDDQTELTDGTIYACVNTGSIEADYQVGGITGIIGVEVSLDPEQDLDTDQEKTLNTVRQAKATVQGCLNEGDITGKRDYIGGVVGKANMGALISNQNYGDITSTDGDYVGGITGSSDYVLRRNYSMCMVTGNDYIGGVTGWGKNVYENYALVTLTSDGGEWIRKHCRRWRYRWYGGRQLLRGWRHRSCGWHHL